MRFASSLTAALAALATAGLAAAQNDECTTALALPFNTLTAFDTSAATLSAQPWPCAASSAPDLWYRFTAPGAGAISVETCGSGYDTALEAFSGGCAALNPIVCNDDSCGLQSRISFPVTAGAQYHVRVGGFGSSSGAGTILATYSPPSGPSDECSGATVLALGAPLNFDTSSATISAPGFPCGFNVGGDLWFRHTAAASGDLIVSTCGSGFDTVLEVFDGTCAALNPIDCNDDFCALQSQLRWTATAGTTYFIRVGGYNNASGGGTLELSTPPPATLAMVSNLPGTWIDISSTGTPLSLGDDETTDIPTTIGNALLASGVATVGSNGAVRFAGANINLGFTNAPIPSANAFGGEQTLMGFWDDINTQGGTAGEIYWQETQGRLIVQWQATEFFVAPGETVTFQIQVPATGPALAQFIYQDVQGARADGGGSATIGYQSGGVQNDVEWSFDTPGSVSNGTVLSLVPIGNVGVGTNYCTANTNSTGQTGAIAGSGSASIAANDLTLRASQLPNNAFGFFITSLTQGNTPNPGGSRGVLCLSGQIGRYVGPGQIKNTGATGAFELLLNLNQIPSPGGFVTAVVGQTRNFQAWHRDVNAGAATSNFTNGLAVTFVQ